MSYCLHEMNLKDRCHQPFFVPVTEDSYHTVLRDPFCTCKDKVVCRFMT